MTILIQANEGTSTAQYYLIMTIISLFIIVLIGGIIWGQIDNARHRAKYDNMPLQNFSDLSIEAQNHIKNTQLYGSCNQAMICQGIRMYQSLNLIKCG